MPQHREEINQQFARAPFLLALKTTTVVAPVVAEVIDTRATGVLRQEGQLTTIPIAVCCVAPTSTCPAPCRWANWPNPIVYHWQGVKEWAKWKATSRWPVRGYHAAACLSPNLHSSFAVIASTVDPPVAVNHQKLRSTKFCRPDREEEEPPPDKHFQQYQDRWQLPAAVHFIRPYPGVINRTVRQQRLRPLLLPPPLKKQIKSPRRRTRRSVRSVKRPRLCQPFCSPLSSLGHRTMF